MKVKALKRHGYGGKIHLQGEEYYIDSEKHVHILSAVKAIRIVLEPSHNQKLSEVKTEKVTTNKREKGKGRGKGKYSRKQSEVQATESGKYRNGKGTYQRKDQMPEKD